MHRWISLSLLLTACTRGGEYREGMDLSTLEFNYFSPTMGVHPDDVVLDDPNNIFASGMTSETKWTLEGNKDREGLTVACFYAWATELAYDPEANTSIMLQPLCMTCTCVKSRNPKTSISSETWPSMPIKPCWTTSQAAFHIWRMEKLRSI